MLIGDGILKYKDDIIYHTCELVKIRSVQGQPEAEKPFGGGVDRALKYVLELGKELGFTTKYVDGYAGHVEFGEGDIIIGILVHLDVVPEGEGWTSPPYSAEIRDGKIFGRGSADDKGPAVVALYALKVLKDTGVLPDKRIRIIFGTNEESGMKDMEYYFTKEPVPDMGFSPDAGYPIYNREKGILRIQISNKKMEAEKCIPSITEIKGGRAVNIVPDVCQGFISGDSLGEDQINNLQKIAREYSGCNIEVIRKGKDLILKTHGKPAHGAAPEGGINAISHLIQFIYKTELHSFHDRFIQFLYEKIKLETNGYSMGINCKDEESGELTLNLGIIDIDSYKASVILDIRYPVTCSGDEIVDEIKKQGDIYNVTVSSSDHQLPLYVKEGHLLLQLLGKAYEKVTGEKVKLLSMGGGTYARTLRNNGVAFGGAEGGNVHQADEYVLIEGLMYHGRICTQAIYELANANLQSMEIDS